MSKFLNRINERVLLCDGAMGTMLYNKGIFINRSYDELNLTNPQLIESIHKEYFNAGAEMLTTNTFGANYYRLKNFNLEKKLKEINAKAVGIAKKIAGSEAFVAGSIGPLSNPVEPLGLISREDAILAFAEQAKILEENGVDVFQLETFSYINDLLVALEAVKSVSSLPIIAQLNVNPDGTAVGNFNPSDKSAVELERAGADVIGLNCSNGPQGLMAGLEQMARVTTKPLIARPNAGSPRNIEGRQIFMGTPEYFSSFTRKYIKLGVKVIGGCCGTTPAHIKEMKASVDSLSPAKTITKIDYSKLDLEFSPMPLKEKSNFARKLANKEFVTSVEIVPPKGCDPEKFKQSALLLKEKGVDGINIPDGPRASSRMSAMMMASIIEREVGIETIMHYTCRDRNILGMQSDLLGAYAYGLKNVLLVTGDPPKMGEYPDATAVFDLDSIGLTRLVNNFNHGIDIIQKPIGKPTGFLIGVGVDPGAIDINIELERFYQKIEAGAEFAITQPVFDMKVLNYFLEKTKDAGIPIIAGIWPLVSYRNAEFMNNEVPGVNIPADIMERLKNCPDKDSARDTGIQIAHETLLEVKSRIQGAQVSAPFGNVKYALDVLGL